MPYTPPPAASSSKIVSGKGTRTTGNVTATTAWANFDTSTDITLTPVTVGQVIEVSLSGFIGSETNEVYFDVATVVSGSQVSVISSGATESGSSTGVAGWYDPASTFAMVGCPFQYTLQAGDISGGQVILRLRIRGLSNTNPKLIRAIASIPFNWFAKVLG